MITPPDDEYGTKLAASQRRVAPLPATPVVDRLKKPFKITLSDDKENTPVSNKLLSSRRPASSQRLYSETPQSVDKLIKPFRCPGSATLSRTSDKPARKRRKVDYGGADGDKDDGDKAWTNEDRLALANRDANRFPVFQVKDKETMFRKPFAVPLINKDTTLYNPNRPPPTLGLRQGAAFVAKPLHDPSGEFAIVLYDPTIDEKPKPIEEAKLEEDLQRLMLLLYTRPLPKFWESRRSWRETDQKYLWSLILGSQRFSDPIKLRV